MTLCLCPLVVQDSVTWNHLSTAENRKSRLGCRRKELVMCLISFCHRCYLRAAAFSLPYWPLSHNCGRYGEALMTSNCGNSFLVHHKLVYVLFALDFSTLLTYVVSENGLTNKQSLIRSIRNKCGMAPKHTNSRLLSAQNTSSIVIGHFCT